MSTVGVDLVPQATIAGRYVLEKQLDEGSFGQVWIANDSKAFNRKVAIKFLLQQHLTNKEVVARFWREGKLIAAVNHPNVVALLECGEENGIPFLVSEFVPGRSLRKVIEERSESKRLFSIDEMLAIFRSVCAGVAAAHEKGIIHRDLKPENVMVSEGAKNLRGTMFSHAPNVKVLDFGIARMLGPSADTTSPHGFKRTEVGRVMGSLQYMAPEQVIGDTPKISERSDVWGLGAILYEILTLREAFDAEAMTDIVTMILSGEPPQPRRLRPDLPAALDAVFAKVFAIGTENRYESVDAFLTAVEQAVGVRVVPNLVAPSSDVSGPNLVVTMDEPAESRAEATTLPELQTRPSTLDVAVGTRNSATSSDDLGALTNKRSGVGKWIALAAGVALSVGGIWYATRPRAAAPSNGTTATTQPQDAGQTHVTASADHDASTRLAMASDGGAEGPAAVDAATASPIATSNADASVAKPPVDTSLWITIAAPGEPFQLGRAAARGRNRVGTWGFAPGAGPMFDGPGFQMQAHEVSWEQYERWAEGNTERTVVPPANVPADAAQRAKYPVTGVSWERAHDFCVSLGGELPSEAQWEFATRGMDHRMFPWGARPPGRRVVAFRGDRAQLAPIGTTTEDVSPEGVFDLAGNAREWTASQYVPDDGKEAAWAAKYKTIRGLPPEENTPKSIPPAGLFRTPGCASHDCNADDLQVVNWTGFRCVRPIPGAR